MNTTPTKAEARVLAALDLLNYSEDYGTPPSMREIAEEAGCSHVQVYTHLRGLVRKGWVRETAARFRKYTPSAKAKRRSPFNWSSKR